MHILSAKVTNLPVFLLKFFLNGLSLLKCLSRRFRKNLPMLMLVNLQKGRLNEITFLFLFLPRLFEWSLLLLLSPTSKNEQVSQLLLLPLEPGFTGITKSSLPWNPMFLMASSYILLLFTKIILHEDIL